MKRFRYLCAATMIGFSSVALGQTHSNYTFKEDAVMYNNQRVVGADICTFRDLGHGYAKDILNVYINGKILDYVDPTTFRLTESQDSEEIGRGGGYRHRRDGNADYQSYDDGYYYDYREEGYLVFKNDVLFNGKKVQNAHNKSFKELGNGYAKDSFRIFYCGNKIDGGMSSSFVNLGGGYAKDSFCIFYRGNKIDGGMSSSFVNLGGGYAKDSFSAYYRGVKITGVTAHSFEYLGRGYAQDSWNTYFLGKKVE